jgi:DNA polymerase-1
MTDMFALMGDASDNVPGVRGIGEKTAVRLISEYGSLENLLDNAASLKGRVKELLTTGRKDAELSKQLVTLYDQVPLDLRWKDCRPSEPDQEKLMEFLRRYEFTSLVKELMPEEGPAIAIAATALACETTVIMSAAELEKVAEHIAAAGFVSVDLETTSVTPSEARIVGISLAVEPERAWYVPVGHATFSGDGQQLEAGAALKILKRVLEDPAVRKLGQNIKYDMLVLRYNGIRLAGVSFDSMVASYCLNPSRTTHNLKAIALDYLGLQMTEIEELIGKGAKQGTMDQVDISRAADYAGGDAVAVLRLETRLEPVMREKGVDRLFHELEMPLVEVLAEMEYAGIKVDRPYLQELSRRFGGTMKDIEQQIYACAGTTFNPNSPKQLSAILFEKLQLPVIRRTKTGYSTDEEVLRTLSQQHELPKKLIEYRELQKLKSTYSDTLLALTGPDNSRIHTSFNQTGTATGRLSSSVPNLQNIPVRSEYGREIRKAFIAETGHFLLSADYSQIDLRVMAHVSGDEVLMRAFRAGEDIHRATAREVFGTEAITADQRRIAKVINFGIIYGMSAYGLAQQLGIDPGEAKRYIDNYFARYQGVKRWLEETVKQARATGRVTTLLGRIRYIPEINASNAQTRGFAERMATNTPIQGTSADIIKVAMINIQRILKERNCGTRMIVQVHDELLFEVPEKERTGMLPLVKKEMEQALTLSIPVVAELKAGMNWAEMAPVGAAHG